MATIKAEKGLVSFTMRQHLTTLWTHRELLWFWIQREVRVRYKQSILGIAWAILQPAALAAIFSLVFSVLVRVPSDGIPYPLFAYAALVPWSFFATSLNQGIPSLVNQMNLITKAAFPKEILPLGAIGASLVDFCFAFGVFIGMLLVYRYPLSATMLWLPLLVLLQTGLAVGVTLIGSALNVFFRDIRFVIPLAVQIWMYATPIVYPSSLVPAHLRTLYALNPMVGIIESYRNIFLHGRPPDWTLLATGALSTTILLLAGYAFFKRVEPIFADII